MIVVVVVFVVVVVVIVVVLLVLVLEIFVVLDTHYIYFGTISGKFAVDSDSDTSNHSHV